MLDGMAHVSTMSSHFVRFDRDRERLVAPGEFDLGPGSRVRALVTAVHFDERRIDFKITDFDPGSRTTERTEDAEGRDASTTRPSKGISSKDRRHEDRRARRGKGVPASQQAGKHQSRSARKAEKDSAPPRKKKGKGGTRSSRKPGKSSK